MNKNLLGHLCLVGANVIYSINYSVAKDVLGSHIQSSGFILLRAFCAMVLYWLTSLFMRFEKIAKEDRIRLFFCGFFGVAVNLLLFFKGLSLTSPINASIMMVCTPILVVVMGYFAMTEKITLLRITGIITGLAGAVFLILNPAQGKHLGMVNWGDLLVLLNACSWGLYLIIVKPLLQKYHTITVVKWVFLTGFIIVLPFGYEQLMVVDWHNMPKKISEQSEKTFSRYLRSMFSKLFYLSRSIHFNLKDLKKALQVNQFEGEQEKFLGDYWSDFLDNSFDEQQAQIEQLLEVD
jgi:drug/metabolite transporter (DMT)-like permease